MSYCKENIQHHISMQSKSSKHQTFHTNIESMLILDSLLTLGISIKLRTTNEAYLETWRKVFLKAYN